MRTLYAVGKFNFCQLDRSSNRFLDASLETILEQVSIFEHLVGENMHRHPVSLRSLVVTRAN